MRGKLTGGTISKPTKHIVTFGIDLLLSFPRGALARARSLLGEINNVLALRGAPI
jgi:hypothetical protein